MTDYSWYTIVNAKSDLMQGDFINECPIVVPPSEITNEEVKEVSIKNYNVVVMSQSCDLAQKNLDLVLVCPVWPLSEVEREKPDYGKPKMKEKLKRGYLPGYHLLNRCSIEKFQTDYLLVDFRNVYSISFDFLVELVQKKGKRVRLLPPYREHLSQAFARFFMRVGLPVDIPSFV